MVRFTSMCNTRFSSNVTEATDHYFEGLTDKLDMDRCYDSPDCAEYRYNSLEMGIFGTSGIYPVNRKYGDKGYFMDFKGGNPGDVIKRM